MAMENENIKRLRLKIIMNPSSGRELARTNVEDMLAYLSGQGVLERADICYTAGPFDATRFAENMKADEYDYVVCVGGDGTVNEVITGIMNASHNIPLAIYTCGTVNDFATSLGMPSEPSDFARMLMNPKLIKTDCGKVNDRYFLNVLAAGLLTDVAYKVPSELKTALGQVAYWIEGLKDLQDINNTIPLRIESNGEVHDIDAVFFFISNSQSVGGFKKLMIQAQMNDGLLDVLVLSKVKYSDVIPLLGKLALGEHLESDQVLYFQTNELAITTSSKTPVTLDLDGEMGPNLPANISCIKDALTLVIPNEEEDL